MSSIIRLALWVSLVPSTSRLLFGTGTLPLHGFVVMFVFGNRLKRLQSLPSRVRKLLQRSSKENGLPEGISVLINGDYKVGEMLTTDKRVPLISATGSTRMGRIVGAKVAERFGRSLLELGGNNAIIVTEIQTSTSLFPAHFSERLEHVDSAVPLHVA